MVEERAQVAEFLDVLHGVALDVDVNVAGFPGVGEIGELQPLPREIQVTDGKIKRRLAKRERRTDLTALPYGPSVPHMFFVVFAIMLPIKASTGAWQTAWQAGMIWVFVEGIMLFLCATLGLAGGRYEAIEFTGPAITALPMQERMTLTNMCTELGAQTGLIAPDATTMSWLAGAGVDADTLAAIDPRQWRTDADAPLLAVHRFDADTLAQENA